jgi:hypothetical protein
MGNKWKAWLPVGILTGSLLLWSAGPSALTFDVVLTSNSTNLSGANAILVFDFISPLDSLSNTATLSTLTSNGTLGNATITGDVTDTGGLGTGPWIFSDLGDTSFFNELLVDFQFNVLPTGTSLSFSFTPLTDNPPLALLPDSFSFVVLDASTFATLIKTNDPTGSDAVFLYSFGQGDQGLSVFTPEDTGISIEVTPSQSAPEPATLALLAAGFAALLQRRRFM